MANVGALTAREIRRIMSRRQTLFLSYLVAGKYVSKYDEEAVILLRNYYKRQKHSWSQKSHDDTHVFVVEYDFETNIVSVHSKINTNIYFCHGVFDLLRVDDYTRARFLAGLYVCEYERRLDEMVSKFRLAKPPSIEDYEFPL
ncbi:hypothetical protein [Enterococcus sp. DIV0170]|uniref:hypothetical protein n=1 Tax=Enterococcus sp. DIV0170 TaxID=2774642 RepID=UPI003F241761